MTPFEQGYEAHSKNDFKTAIGHYHAALSADFNDARTLYFLGTAYFQNNDHGIAANLLARAVECAKGDPEVTKDALVNLGACYKGEDNWQGAADVWQMAIEQARVGGDRDTVAGCLANLGSICVLAGKFEDALRFFDESLTVKPGDEQALFNRGQCQLALGNWSEGWDGYEHAIALGNRKSRQYFETLPDGSKRQFPVWNGEPGQKVIVYGEQGLGDEILYGSCLPDLMKTCDVVLDCHPRLVKTWRRSFGIPCYGTRKSEDVSWLQRETPTPDAAVMIGSLPKFFRPTRESFPGTPYLKVDGDAVARHRQRSHGKMRIGVSWIGGTKKTGKKFRSFPLATMAPLFAARPDADWYSLQYTSEAGKEVQDFEADTGVHVKHWPRFVECFDYDETVNFIASLNLVVTCCTTVLHVAGALGVPCWVLVPDEAAWRESGNVPGLGATMPWYSSVHLIHKQGREWAGVMDDVAFQLAQYPAAHHMAAE